MPAILTHKSIMLLALDRLQQVRESLEAKRVSGLEVNPIDLQVLYLARRAFEMMSTAPHAQVRFPARPFTTALGTWVSTYAVMGSMGPQIPAYAALFAPGQAWAGSIMRKGNPDANREAVVARSVDFILEFWRRAEGQIAALPEPRKISTRDKLRAYALGHLCRVASEMIVNPYLDDVEGHLGSVVHPTRLSREAAEAAIDATVADRVLLGPGTRRGAVWTAWWPGVDDVPDEFYQAFSGAFEAVYLANGRPLGFAEFEERFTQNLPPAMSHRLVRDGYQAFRALLERGYDWTFGDWLVALIPLFAPVVVTMPFTALLKEGKNLLAGTPHDEAKAWAEALGLPLSATSLVPLATSVYLAAWTSMGVGTETIVGLIVGGLVLVAAVVFFSTLGSDIPAWAQIVFLFMLPVVLELAYFVWLQIRGGGEKFHRLLGWAFLAHVVLAALSTFAYALFREWITKGPGDILFWLGAFLWLLVVGGLWLLSALLLKDSAAPEMAGDSFATSRRHFVRLFDDASLFHERRVVAPTLADQFYPSGPRKLLRIWWEGDGEMHIRPRRHSVEFSVAGADAAGDRQIILAPIAPMTMREYAAVLRRTVKDHVGAAGGLRVAVVHETDPDYDLPPGETFADHGDLDDTVQTQAQHEARANTWTRLGKSSTEREYFLYHSPKARQSIQYGPQGPVVPDLRSAEDSGGAATVGPAVGGGPNDVDGTGTRFLTFFKVGDAIDAPAGTRRTIVAITSDTRLTTVLPLGLGGPGVAFRRVKQDRTVAVQGPGQAAIAPGALTTVVGSGGSQFAGFFMPGDIIRVDGVERKVVAVTGDASLTVDGPFPVTPATNYFRMPTEGGEGYAFVASPASDFTSGDSVMDLAADLAVLLCIGGTSYLLTEEERRAAPLGAPAPVNKVVQVFRNWDLDRRRVNEWRMLVAGGGTSEKRGAPEAPDPALPPLPEGWTLRSTRGEGIATSLGWIPLFQKWLDVARRPGVSSRSRVSLRPGDPTNLDLSRAVAFLFDMPDPDPTPP